MLFVIAPLDVTLSSGYKDFKQARAHLEKVYGSICSEPIRKVYRDLMRLYFRTVREANVLNLPFLRICVLTRKDLERKRLFGGSMKIKAASFLIIEKDAPTELADEAIESIHLLGVVYASREI